MIVHFSPAAKEKMWNLVNYDDNLEIGWFGVCEKYKDMIYVKDILVYPQERYAAHFETDDREMMQWYLSLPDDVINKIRFAGHSHVNFPAVPSGTDIADEQRQLDVLGENDYFLWFILNRKREFSLRYYDPNTKKIFERRGLMSEPA